MITRPIIKKKPPKKASSGVRLFPLQPGVHNFRQINTKPERNLLNQYAANQRIKPKKVHVLQHRLNKMRNQGTLGTTGRALYLTALGKDKRAKAILARRHAKNAPASKKPHMSAIQKYLATDTDYQRTLNNLNTNIKAYATQNTANQRNLKTDYNTTKSRLKEQQGKDQTMEKADYSSRGLFGSGMQSKDYNDLNKSYNQQYSDTDTSYTRNLTQLKSDRADAERLKRQQAAEARAEAIRRRAAKYGITGNPPAKPKGKGKKKPAHGKKPPHHQPPKKR